MSNYNSLKATIDANIKQNGRQEITGQILNSVLNAMVTTLGTGYQFAGVATIATNPGTPDAKVFYIANGKGTYEKFGGLDVTEDDVVFLVWDNAWHKVATGIAADAQLKEAMTELTEIAGKVDTKQNELTLTVKDNGNIVIGNIQGQTKEFMPATPSGDPMHYAYVTAGAVWNGTGADIVKTTPWADLADDDADKTVVHKAGYWYLNGLGDITNEQMRFIYNNTISFGDNTNMDELLYGPVTARTNINKYHNRTEFGTATGNALLGYNNYMEVVMLCAYNKVIKFSQVSYIFTHAIVRNVIGIISAQNISFANTANIKTIKIQSFKNNVSFKKASMLTSKSILYMIQNEAATSAITITLHADAYARAMANADIVAALEAHPNVSLASA